MLIPVTDISKTFKSCFLLIIKNILCLSFFQKLQKSELKYSNCSNFNILLWFLINLINDDTFVWAATTDACSTVHLVCLFTKTHLLALLQDNCLDLLCCTFLRKFSVWMRNITAFYQHLMRPIKSSVLTDTNILAKPKYWPIISARSIYRSISSGSNKQW